MVDLNSDDLEEAHAFANLVHLCTFLGLRFKYLNPFFYLLRGLFSTFFNEWFARVLHNTTIAVNIKMLVVIVWFGVQIRRHDKLRIFWQLKLVAVLQHPIHHWTWRYDVQSSPLLNWQGLHEQISFKHYFYDSQLVITMNMSNENYSCCNQHLINLLFCAKVVKKLAIAPLSAVHQYCTPVVWAKVVNSASTSVLRWLHTRCP